MSTISYFEVNFFTLGFQGINAMSIIEFSVFVTFLTCKYYISTGKLLIQSILLILCDQNGIWIKTAKALYRHQLHHTEHKLPAFESDQNGIRYAAAGSTFKRIQSNIRSKHFDKHRILSYAIGNNS